MHDGKPTVVADNTLARRFDVEAQDKAWVTDITYIRTQEGFAYLAVVIDLFSRRVIGWSLQSRQVVAHGGMATEAEDHGPGTLGSGLPVHKHGLSSVPEAPQP